MDRVIVGPKMLVLVSKDTMVPIVKNSPVLDCYLTFREHAQETGCVLRVIIVSVIPVILVWIVQFFHALESY